MADSAIGGVSVRIGADTTGLSKGINDAKGQLSSFDKSVVSSAATLGKMAGAAVAAGVAITVALTAKAMDAIGAQADLAKQLNTTYASLSAVKIAASLSGVEMSTVEQASKKLNVTLGQVASGGGEAAKKALDRLHLSASELAALPADERITKINSAITQFIPQAQQAAVASELFGARAGQAMLMLDAEAMAEAAKQAEIFGLALSEVDAAKVEMAGDAMEVFGIAAQGITTQLAVKFAPVLRAVAEEFLGVSQEAGGFGTIAEKVFNSVIAGTGYVMDAIAGIKRVVSLVVDAGIYAFESLKLAAIDVAHSIVATIDSLPGIDLSATVKSLAAAEEQSKAVLAAIRQNMEDTLTEPMPSEKLQKFVAEAQKSAQGAAEAAVASRPQTTVGTDAPQEVDTKAADAAKKAAEAEAKRALDAVNGLRQQYMTEEELLTQKLANENKIIADALAAKQITQDEADALALSALTTNLAAQTAIEEKATQQRIALAKAEKDAKLSAVSGMFGNLSTLMNTGSKKLFEIGKASAIAQAIVSTYVGATKALELGPILGPAAAASMVVAGMVNVANIRKQSFGGSSGGGAAPSPTMQASANAAPAQSTAQQQQRTNVTFVGDTFGGGNLVGMLNSLGIDGYTFQGAT